MASTGSAAGGGGSSREGSAKGMVADQISQAVQSTSNLLHLMQHSSPAQAQLIKLPKNLLAKVSTIKNTEQVLEQMPGVISSLDAHMENGLQNVLHLKTVVQLLANMESSQLNSLSLTHPLQKAPKFYIGSMLNSNGGDLGVGSSENNFNGLFLCEGMAHKSLIMKWNLNQQTNLKELVNGTHVAWEFHL